MKDQYTDEAQHKWGHTQSYKIAAQRTQKYTADDWARIKADAQRIYFGFYACQTMPLNSVQVADWVNEWQQHLDQNFYPCNDTMLRQLVELYEQDPRYAKNIDKVGGQGTAEFMSKAIRFHRP